MCLGLDGKLTCSATERALLMIEAEEIKENRCSLLTRSSSPENCVKMPATSIVSGKSFPNRSAKLAKDSSTSMLREMIVASR